MSKKFCFLPAVLMVLAFRGDVSGQQRAGPETGMAPPYRSWKITQVFKANERATFVAVGSGTTYLGLYVYDDQGNCVAWDDQGNFATRDDIAVSWIPERTGRYTIEVCNLGRRRNVFEYSIR